MTFVNIEDLYKLYEESDIYVDMKKTKENKFICFGKENDQK